MVTTSMRLERIEQGAAMLVLPGLLLTVLTQDMLSGGATKGILAALLVLDLIMIHWLTKPDSTEK